MATKNDNVVGLAKATAKKPAAKTNAHVAHLNTSDDGKPGGPVLDLGSSKPKGDEHDEEFERF